MSTKTIIHNTRPRAVPSGPLVTRVTEWLPKGGSLPEDDWLRRHRAITQLLIAQSAGLSIFGVLRGYALLHVVGESLIPLLCAVVANLPRVSRAQKAIVAAFGLVACSGIFVHLSGGTIEAHFHFFIMLAVISLYQEWLTFLLAIGFVAIHHGLVGVLDPDAVYNHEAAIADPWTWALIHATLVLGESMALIAAWRFSEAAHARAEESGRRLIEQEGQRLQEQADAQAAMVRRDAQLEEAQQIARLGSWEWDPATGVVESSDELLRLFGLEPGTTAPDFETYMNMIHADDRGPLEATLQRALDSRQPYTTEARIVKPDGSTSHLSFTGKVVTDSDGAPVRVIGTAQDITDHKLLESQLAQAQKMEAVGQLAGGVAHDFNNLLSVVTSYGSFVRDELSEDDPSRADVEEIIKAGERGAKLTRQLLTFSRKDVVQPQHVNANELISEMHKLLSRTIQENIRLSTRLCPNIWTTEIDPGELEQVIMNLAINAKDAMPNGGDLVIETDNIEIGEDQGGFRPGLKPGAYVRIQVSDTGIGMSKDVQARIFEPFYTTKGIGKGTGLGLATAYGIVTRAKGSLSVYSEVGVGSTFKVYLPRSESDGKVTRGGSNIRADAVGKGELILVVEDEEAVLEATSRILARNGYAVLKASNGLEALKLVDGREGNIDLLVTDVIMPEVSGRELSERTGIKTLYTSGYTNELIAQQGILAENENFLQKPFSTEQLLRAVRSLLDGDDAHGTIRP